MHTRTRPSLRPVFQRVAATVTLALAPLISMTSAAATPASFQSHRDQGECPAPVSATPTPPTPFAFSANPREQQRLLESIGLVIGRETPDGIFRERTLQSINEFRQFYYGAKSGRMPFVQSLTESELADLRSFAGRVASARSQYGLSLEAATALSFAQRATEVELSTLVAETNKGKSGFGGTAADFLYLVKTTGDKYNLGSVAQHIEVTTRPDGAVLTRIKDPVTFLLAEALRRHPRLALSMEAERIKLGDDMPRTDYHREAPPAGIPLNRLQSDLLTLGFDTGGIDKDFGPKTEAAYHLYRTLYAPLLAPGQDIDAAMTYFADLAQKDARTYGVSAAAAAAIRLGTLRTGVDFGYMMELSAAESGFNHTISASTSSAAGLYQFTEDTWLQTVRRYGAWYGMGPLSAQMLNMNDMNGMLVGRVENPFIRTAAFDLRVQPHLMALLAAEFQLRNQFRIVCAINRPLNRTEMYFGHFLGAEGAITFLQNRARTPKAAAARAFPRQAAANRNVFFARGKRGKQVARSYNDVYAFFNKKFGRDMYEDSTRAPIPGLELRAPQDAHKAASPLETTVTRRPLITLRWQMG